MYTGMKKQKNKQKNKKTNKEINKSWHDQCLF